MNELSPLGRQFFEKGKVDDCPVYDLHGHMGSFYGAHFPLADPDSAVQAMDRAGVRLLVFCHHAALLGTDIGNAANIEAARRHPNRLRAYCGINPNYPEIARRDVESFDDYADVYVGLKFLADYHLRPITDSAYEPAWRMADERGLPVLLHTWAGSGFSGPSQIRAAAERYPNARILMGHCIHGDWTSAIQLSNRFANVYLELCAVLDERGVLETLVAECGSEKILFGTDFPWFGFHYYIGAVLGADIGDEDRRNIFHRNARKLLRMC